MIRLNAEQIQMMKDELTVELADWLMETYGYSRLTRKTLCLPKDH